MTRWSTREIPDQAGRRAIVTGANSGLGFQTAYALVAAGADVVLACRSPERGEAAAARIGTDLPAAKVSVSVLDTSSLASVRAFAARELAGGKPVDLLVNNAGIMAVPKRSVSADGLELQMATNYFGHYALTGLLLPSLLRAGAPRVVSVSSNAHKRGRLHLDDPQQESGYNAFKSYSQTKLAMLVYARELQRRAGAVGSTLVSTAAHPGLATPAIGQYTAGPAKYAIPVIFRLLGQDDKQGALPQLYAAVAADAEPGGYYGPSGFSELKGPPAPAKVSPRVSDAAAAARLWALSGRLTGVTLTTGHPQPRFETKPAFRARANSTAGRASGLPDYKRGFGCARQQHCGARLRPAGLQARFWVRAPAAQPSRYPRTAHPPRPARLRDEAGQTPGGGDPAATLRKYRRPLPAGPFPSAGESRTATRW